MPPTEAEVASSAKYDAMLAEGSFVYEVFIRAKGPNQWFPVGPMAVKQVGPASYCPPRHRHAF